ncbi:MAG: sigma-70 family RNA polymerase sigma factor, partial [Planctomycetota bacterium]
MHSPSPIDPRVLLAEASFVHRLARALVRQEDLAHDVAQEVLAAALQQQRSPQSLRAWLVAVTRRLAGKQRREHQERARREALGAGPEGDNRAQRTADRLHLHRRLTDAVLSLPEPYRTVLTLRFFDERSPRAIAQEAGRSSEVVRQQLHRGLAMLRQKLDAEFGDRGAWATAFATAGWLTCTAPTLVLSTLVMKNTVLVAVCVLTATAFWFWPRAEQAALSVATGPTPPAAAPAVVAERNTETEQPAGNRRVPAVLPHTETCEVQVVDDAGAPIAAATVHCWANDGAVSERRTDHAGRTSFGYVRGPGGLLVRAIGRQLRTELRSELLGDHHIVMPTGRHIAGLLMVDGQLAAAGFR